MTDSWHFISHIVFFLGPLFLIYLSRLFIPCVFSCILIAPPAHFFTSSPGNMKFGGVLVIACLEKFRCGMACDDVRSIKWRYYDFYEDLMSSLYYNFLMRFS